MHLDESDCKIMSKVNEIKVAFGNGLIGRISKEDFSDTPVGCKMGTRVRKGQPVHCRILEIDYVHFTAKCSSKTSVLNDEYYK